MCASEARPRRWLQFSLRTLFVLMLLVATFFGGRESMRPAIQAERVKALRTRELAEQERALALAAAAQAEFARSVALKQEEAFERQLLELREGGGAPTDSESHKSPNMP